VVYGDGLEIRQPLSLLVLPDTIWCYLVKAKTDFCIWLCYPVPLGAKQFVGKMSAVYVVLRVRWEW